jgi:hypothetical protein
VGRGDASHRRVGRELAMVALDGANQGRDGALHHPGREGGALARGRRGGGDDLALAAAGRALGGASESERSP